MPSIHDIPGTGLVSGVTKRARVFAAGAGTAVVEAGGFLTRHVLGHRADDEASATAAPAAVPPPPIETPVPGSKTATESVKPKPPRPKPAKPAPKPKPGKPKPAKPKAAKPKAAKAKPAKPKAAPKAKAAKPKARTTGTDAPPKPAVEPGNISGDKEPHHALNNPVVDPDETEYPDPYEKRDDPLGPG
ncbi:MAG TPA: hypothetical protein VH268_10060, partial [Solirubrobacterales bacterium]|nr:hypothetical protein [Solirubrobacterales bacterium]